MSTVRNAECGMRNERPNRIAAALFLALTLLVCSRTTYAEIKVIEADSAYVMGDNDSRIDARRIAVQEAKRKALEQAGTYLESVSEIRNYQLTKDEVKAYTAGVAETEIVADEMRGSVNHPEVYIKTRCRVDTQLLTAAIDRYRDNEDLKEQVQAAAKENDQLKKERNGLVKQLAAEKDKTKAEATRKKLDSVLDREETNEETDKVWAKLAYRCGESDENGAELTQADADRSTAVLERVVKVNPGNQRALYLLSALYQKKGEYDAAEDQSRAAILKNPSNPVPHMKLGILLHSRSKNEEALKEFHFVERLRPHNSMMLYYTGMTLKDMRRCGLSIQYLQRFLKNPAAAKYTVKKKNALQGIEDCGGARGGYQRRVRYP